MIRKIKGTAVMLLMVLGVIFMLSGCSPADVEAQQAAKNAGIEALKNGDAEGALNDFNEALAASGTWITPQVIDICYYKAAAQNVLGDTDGAIATYTALIDYDDNNAAAYFLRGSIYIGRGDSENGFNDYKEATSRAGTDYEMYRRIYYNLNEHGYPEKAVEYLNMALAIEGTESYQYYERGRIYYIMEQYDVAESAFLNAIEKGSTDAWIELARVYVKKGDTESAEDALNHFNDVAEPTGESYNAIGVMYMERGDYDLALAAIRQGMLIADEDSMKELMKNEIAALEYTGDFVGARVEAQSYIEKYQDDPDVARELVFLNTR
ncbi:MAG: tetratricopeptide repeat protein [Lachnospiraceae bacterium]|nr:tetratricopeptide repeat protein [Lachnospiraceae bacterium]